MLPVVWRRVGHLYEEPRLFGKEPHPTDIQQGALGNFWFLACLAALAEFPELIRRVFRSQEVDSDGVYEIVLWKKGCETTVIVDDWLPCSERTGELCFSRGRKGELWVALLEKAWAKLHGSYMEVEVDVPYRTLTELTGLPGSFLPCDSESEAEIASFWQSLCEFSRSGFIMLAVAVGCDIPDGPYTLLSVQDFKGQQLVCLRDPFGSFEWRGRWSDSSDDWDNESKEALDYKPGRSEGIFWMCKADVLARFAGLHVLHCRGEHGVPWNSSREAFGLKGGDGFLIGAMEFTMDTPMQGLLMLFQEDDAAEISDFSALAFAIYGPLSATNALPQEVLRSECLVVHDLVQKVPELNPGSYIVAVWHLGSHAHTGQAALSLHLAPSIGCGGGRLQARAVQPNNAVVQMAVASSASTHSDCKLFTGEGTISTGWLPYGGFALVVAEHSNNLPLRVLLEAKGSKGLLLMDAKDQCRSAVVEPSCRGRYLAELRPTAMVRSVEWRLSWQSLKS